MTARDCLRSLVCSIVVPPQNAIIVDQQPLSESMELSTRCGRMSHQTREKQTIGQHSGGTTKQTCASNGCWRGWKRIGFELYTRSVVFVVVRRSPDMGIVHNVRKRTNAPHQTNRQTGQPAHTVAVNAVRTAKQTVACTSQFRRLRHVVWSVVIYKYWCFAQNVRAHRFEQIDFALYVFRFLCDQCVCGSNFALLRDEDFVSTNYWASTKMGTTMNCSAAPANEWMIRTGDNAANAVRYTQLIDQVHEYGHLWTGWNRKPGAMRLFRCSILI